MATIVADEQVPTGPPDAGKAHRAENPTTTAVWLWALGLALLTSAVYANSLRAPYLFDDKYFFERDVTYKSVDLALASPASRRLGVLTFALEYRWHGRSPIGCHAVNVLIHVTAGLLLFGLVRRTLGLSGVAEHLSSKATVLAGFCAAIWLVHPLQTSAVTYVIQRFESLMGLWFLLALYGLVRGATAHRAWPWYLLALVADWLGVQTKEVMAMLPIVALAYDRIFLSRGWRELWRRRGWLHLGFVACSAWMVYEIRWAFDPSVKGSAGMGTPGVSSWEYLRSQGGVILHYLRLSVWPDYLCLDYRWPIARTAAEIYVPGTVIAIFVGLTGWALWRCPKLGFLGVAFFAILAPTSSVMPITDLAFEHRMYLPLASVIGLIVLTAAYWVDRYESSWPAVRWAAIGAAVVVASLLSARTVARNWDYQDAIRMWQSVVRARPDNERAYNVLAVCYETVGRLDDAQAAFQKTLELRPDAYWAEIGLGTLAMRRGRYDDAQRHFEQARANPRAVPVALANLGALEAKRGNHAASYGHFREAVALDPNNIQVRIAFADACLRTGRSEDAVKQLLEVLQLETTSGRALRRLADILATSDDDAIRDGEEAVRWAERLVRLTGESSAVDLDLLAAAYAAVGRFEDAVKSADRALRLPVDSETRLRIRERRKKYQRGEAIYAPVGDKK